MDNTLSIRSIKYIFIREIGGVNIKNESFTLKELEDLMKKKEKRFNNVNVMDYLVITCILSILAFTAVSLYYYYNKEIPPTQELMSLFFAFFGGELLAMAGITISKHRKEKGDDDEC